MRHIVLSLLVENTSGVLSRIAGLFSRRAYNIDSISCGSALNSEFSRITIMSHGDDDSLEQLIKQVSKLVDVVDVEELEPGSSVLRELVLVKIAAQHEVRQEIMTVANIFRARIVDVSEDSMTLELTGDSDKQEAFIGLIEKYKILQMARTGVTGLRRGVADNIGKGI